MSTLSDLPWNTQSSDKSNNSNSTESLEDEEEVYPRISEEIFDQLPTRLRQNLRILQQEVFDRLSRTNPNPAYHAQNPHQRPADQHESEERTPATPSQNNSNFLATHRNQDKEPSLAMDEESSKYLSIRNPEPRGSKAGDGRGNDEGERGKKRVKFDLPEPEYEDGEQQHGDAREAGVDPFQGPVAEENFEYFEDYQPRALETTGPWTATARFQNIISGETSNPYAPYTSALREEARASVVENLGELDDGKKRKRWFYRFLKFIGLKSRKDKKL